MVYLTRVICLLIARKWRGDRARIYMWGKIRKNAVYDLSHVNDTCDLVKGSDLYYCNTLTEKSIIVCVI